MKDISSVWNRFDYIALVCFTGYKDRVEELKPELERVGLLDKVHFHWDFPSSYRDKLYNACGMSPYNSKGGSFFMGVNHYNAIKTAQQLGCDSILVMEDDIRFLNDIDKIKNIIDSTPSDYDLALFDRSKPSCESMEEFEYDAKNRIVSRFWREYNYASSCGMYALSRKGINHYLEILEHDIEGNCICNSDFYFKRFFKGRNYWDRDSRLYFSYPSVAVQTIAGKSGSHCSMEQYWDRNEFVGIKQEDYNMKPVITKSNFLQKLYEAADRKINDNISLSTNEKGHGFFRCDITYSIPYTFRKMKVDNAFSDGKFDWCFIWGNGDNQRNIDSLSMAYRDNAPIVFCEDGFIRSYDTWVNKNAAPILRTSHSLIFDTSAYYFDATRISNVEKMLNDKDFVVTEDQMREARRIIDRIVANKISKYNHQPIVTPTIGREGVRKVLVVDQSYGDFSIKRGLANDKTFEDMLDAAVRENPDADILVKTHPDTMAGKKGEKKGYYQNLVEHDNVYKVTFPINPYSLMEVCDKVYVCSSQFGIEALMAGKEVHTFGMPFYAGWGATIDAQHLERRTNTRSLEEIFYIFYCVYTHWIDIGNKCETTIDSVIDEMISLRETVNTHHEKLAYSQIIEQTVNIPKVWCSGGFKFGSKSPNNEGFRW